MLTNIGIPDNISIGYSDSEGNIQWENSSLRYDFTKDDDGSPYSVRGDANNSLSRVCTGALHGKSGNLHYTGEKTRAQRVEEV